jgi:DNA-binding transcriptional regulator PaaX
MKYHEKLKNFLASGTAKANIATVALCVLAIASLPALVLIAASMGNAVQVFKSHRYSSKYSQKQIRSSINSLKRQKLIEYVADKNGKSIVKITQKGQARLRAFAIDLINIKKSKKWDGKWRLVMYDLPIRFKKARESLRWKLKDLGFFQFQKSAWVYPYPCEDEVIFIADFYGVGKYVEVLTVENFLQDQKLKERFGL